MRRVAAFSLAALLVIGSSGLVALAQEKVSAEQIDALIAKLAEPEPADRAAAYDKLKVIGLPAVPALRRAVRNPQPNIADSAAQLLLQSRWWTSNDPPDFRKIVTGYGQLPPDQRAERVKLMIDQRLSKFQKYAIRVLMQDPADEVGWRALQDVDGDPDWDAALSAQKLEDLTPALQLQLAKSKDRAGDHDTAAKLAKQVLDLIRDDPSVPGKGLNFAVHLVVEAESAAGRFDQAAIYLREQFAHASGGGQSDVLDQLLDLHIRHGPLPGLSDDIKRSDTDGEPHGTIALALMADRVGMPLAGSALLGAVTAQRQDESPIDRAARLFEIGVWLSSPGQATEARTPLDDAACRVYEQVTTSDETTQKARILESYIRISEIHERNGQMQFAGDALQRVIDRADGPLARRFRSGRVEPWSVEEQQGRLAWYYLLDARARGDKEAISKHAHALIASGSLDSTFFLDSLPALNEAAPAEEVDNYFDRLYQKAETRVIESPAEPVFLNDIAWLCARSGRKLDKAVDFAQRAVKLVPEPAYLDTLAEAKFRTGKIKEAIELETRALATQPEDEHFMLEQLARFRAAATTRPND